MIEALRNLDRKFWILIVCLILIPTLLIVFLVLAQSCSNKKTDYSKYEFQMKSAAKKHLKETDQIPNEDGEYILVPLNLLVEKSYIESPSKKLGDSTCNGYIGVRKHNTVTYTAVLNCNNYNTNTLAETLKKDLTTESDGLYETKNGYVFKGLNVNNYINLAGVEYRILGIDKNNSVKVIKTESESLQIRWDYKFNVNTNQSTGINKYADSYLLERLNKIYNDNSKIKKIKSYMVPTEVCVYAQAINNRFLSDTCKEILTNQYITVIGIDDFMKASLDPNCVDLYSKSCKNYNYLGRLGINTWTKDVVADNDYQVYYLSGGIPTVQTPNLYDSYNIVIFLNGDLQVKSGNGTKQSPYLLN